jgi:hypothetical protein
MLSEAGSLRYDGFIKTFFFFLFCFGISTFVLLTLLIPALGCPLSNRFLQVCGDRIAEWMSGSQQSNWRLYRKPYPRDHFRNNKAASRKQVCVLWWTLSGLTSIKEAVSCNLNLAYLPCCLDQGITRMAGYIRQCKIISNLSIRAVLVGMCQVKQWEIRTL